MTVDDFQSKWDEFLERHQMGENEWLKGLFEERHRWVPLFMKSQFWAGMSNTQRSEGMHAFMKRHLTPRSNLDQFVRQFDNCLAWKTNNEREADDDDSVLLCHVLLIRPLKNNSSLSTHGQSLLRFRRSFGLRLIVQRVMLEVSNFDDEILFKERRNVTP